MSFVYFFTDQNRTLGPYGGCNQGLSEKISLVIGSLATQVTVFRYWTEAGPHAYVTGIAAGNFTRTLLIS